MPEYNSGNDTFLRDALAVDRTKLANERTLLAYIRTALAIAIVGGTLVQFFESAWPRVAGFSFLVGAGILLGVGVVRFRAVHRRIEMHNSGKGGC